MSQKPNFAAFLNAPGAKLTVSEAPTPIPSPGEVLVRNHAVALNPLDWKRQAFDIFIPSYPTILGADLAGEIISSDSASPYPAGTRVAGVTHALSSGNLSNSAFQNYTAIKISSLIPLPASIPYTQGATLATSTGTAALILYDLLSIPLPSLTTGPSITGIPPTLLVWGGSSAIGTMAIQLAKLSGVQNIIAAASGKHHGRLRSLGATTVVDYSSPSAVEDVVAAIEKGGREAPLYVVDPVSSPKSAAPVVEVLKRVGAGSGTKVANTLPWPAGLDVPEGVQVSGVAAQDLWGRREDLATWLFGEALPKWLGEGEIVPVKARVVEGGLKGIQKGLEELMRGVSGEKLVVEL
ncbi:chaperonin 10-like protein [Cercophora newfieldiana]|uniref:Chaperonin 10-like protein n=1 Tax=Cercophora newfieldiana TaxID=92897 RepID=A0AA39XX46_9PEZI|nr:chaperonin 10-like protein [Cercophora newfieldiana]